MGEVIVSCCPHIKKFYSDYISANKGKVLTLAEVGTYKGHSISELVENLQAHKVEFELFAVDLWDMGEYNTAGEGLQKKSYDIYNSNLNKRNFRKYIKDVKCDSALGSFYFPDKMFDMVFIDANHTYEYVFDDIACWLPKIKPGGIMAGHDYTDSEGVRRAVRELLGDVVVEGSVWRKLIN